MNIEHPGQNKAERAKEVYEEISAIFDEAEALFEREGREPVKAHLITLYERLIAANGGDRNLSGWAPSGELAQEDFDELNLRRKKLSNAVGIMTASGVVRHDLNKI
jgi:hypothetical protein